MYNPLSDPATILALATFFLVFSGLVWAGLKRKRAPMEEDSHVTRFPGK